jgi:hypothetical protein
LFSKLKSHELSCKGRPNHDASLTSKALVTSDRVGGHNANPTTTVSSTLEFALSSLAASFDEQYESIPYDEIALLTRKFRALMLLLLVRLWLLVLMLVAIMLSPPPLSHLLWSLPSPLWL